MACSHVLVIRSPAEEVPAPCQAEPESQISSAGPRLGQAVPSVPRILPRGLSVDPM